jgi:hypothetical protein
MPSRTLPKRPRGTEAQSVQGSRSVTQRAAGPRPISPSLGPLSDGWVGWRPLGPVPRPLDPPHSRNPGASSLSQIRLLCQLFYRPHPILLDPLEVLEDVGLAEVDAPSNAFAGQPRRGNLAVDSPGGQPSPLDRLFNAEQALWRRGYHVVPHSISDDTAHRREDGRGDFRIRRVVIGKIPGEGRVGRIDGTICVVAVELSTGVRSNLPGGITGGLVTALDRPGVVRGLC